MSFSQGGESMHGENRSAVVLHAPPPAALRTLECTLESSVDGKRLYLPNHFTKLLLAQTLGLPTDTTAPLSLLILQGVPHNEQGKVVKLKFTKDAEHPKAYLKLGSNFIERLGLQGSKNCLKMEYLGWQQQSAGGKTGKNDFLYHFTLELIQPTTAAHHTPFPTSSMAPSTSTSPSPAQPNREVAMMSNLSQLPPNISNVLHQLVPPEPGRPLVQKFSITAGLGTCALSLQKDGFYDALVRGTMGILHSDAILRLELCFLIDKGPESVLISTWMYTKHKILNRWNEVRALLGGFKYRDQLVLRFLGEILQNGRKVYYFEVNKESTEYIAAPPAPTSEVVMPPSAPAAFVVPPPAAPPAIVLPPLPAVAPAVISPAPRFPPSVGMAGNTTNRPNPPTAANHSSRAPTLPGIKREVKRKDSWGLRAYNLLNNVTESAVLEEFSRFGQVLHSSIKRFPKRKKKASLAYVRYSDYTTALVAKNALHQEVIPALTGTNRIKIAFRHRNKKGKNRKKKKLGRKRK